MYFVRLYPVVPGVEMYGDVYINQRAIGAYVSAIASRVSSYDTQSADDKNSISYRPNTDRVSYTF